MAGWLVPLCLLHVLGGAYGSSSTPYNYGPGGLGGLLAGGGSVSNPSSCSGCGLDKMVTNCPLDVMFILDGSDSIPPRSFLQAQQYVVNQIQNVTATFQGVNVGVLLFSDGVNRELPLQDRTPQQLTQLSAEVTQLRQPRMATELTATLRRARRALVDYGGLPLVPGGKRGKVIVLVSDGCDDEAGATRLEGVQATLDGIYIISVHVSGGSTAYMKVLTDLSQQVLEIRTPIDWSSVAACPAVFLPPRPAGSVCSNVVFAMDGSDSVRKWETVMRDYLAYTTIRYASVDNAIGVIVFGTNVATQSTDTMLPPTKDKMWLAEQIETHLRFPHSGGTGTTAAIQTASAMLGALGSGSVNTIVVVTDGPALNPETAREALMSAAASGFHVVVIGVGDILTQEELQVMAGPGSTVLMVAGYLELFALDLGPQLCQTGPVCNTQALQCSSTQITNLQTCSCACNLAYQCPSGQTLNPITCACAPRTCTLNCNNGRADANCQSCICNTGFTGPTCTSAVCNLVCRNGGTLFTANNNCQCQCRPDYGGNDCSVCTKQCLAPQVLDQTSCTCRCNTGYACPTGQQLDTSACTCARIICNLNCGNGAADANCQQCICNQGFMGSDCSQRICTLSCGNGVPDATCQRCICNSGYTGTFCTDRICTLNCNNGVRDANCQSCICNTGYTGTFCTERVCTLNCNNGVRDANCQSCICNTGYTGTYCTERICTLNCNNGARDANCQRCICNAGYTGTYCTDRICTLSCNNGVPDANCQRCVCYTGYTGTYCTDRVCTLNCNNGSPDSACTRCICNTGYTGTYCTVRDCTQTTNCPSGTYFDSSSCTCQRGCAQTLNCPSRTYFDTQTCTCQPGCAQTLNCGSGTYFDTLTCTCRPGCAQTLNCGSGQYFDTTTCTCRTGCAQTLNCAAGQNFDTTTCTCRTVCQTRSCPIGQVFNTTTCACAQVVACRQAERCSPGTYFNEDVCRCVPACTTVCSPPQQLDVINCVCRTPCNPQTVRCVNGAVDTTTCQCVCRDGYTGADCSFCSRQCNVGETLNPSSCICSRLLCSNTCQNGGQMNQATCQCSCPAGFSGPSCENNDVVSVETCSAAQSPCKNGGVAIKDCQGRCICKCDESRFAGVFCEIPATAELCNDCWNQNGQFLAGLPGRTDMYVVCQPLNVQRTRFLPWLMHCPPRTIFQRDPITGWFGCDHIGRGIPASDPCRNRTLAPAGKYASSDQCAHYFQCGSDGYTSKKACCPAGYRFDSSIGDCVADSNCPCVPDLDCLNNCNGSAGVCPVGRDQGPSGPVCPYESLSGKGFYHKASPAQPYNCSVGQKFDSSPDVCRCVKDASQGCLPTVEADYIQGTNENPGYFSGSRREVFERFGGSGFHTDYFEIRLRLKLDRNFGTNNGEMAVVTNGDCGEKESVSITASGNNVNFKIDGEQGELQQISVPYSTPSDGWLQISLVYEKQPGQSGTYLLTGTVNGQSDKLTVSGKIEMRMCALQIGKGFNYASLVGYVDDFQVWLCKPSTSG